MEQIHIVFILLASLINTINPTVLLYNTEGSDSIEELECIYYTQDSTVKYCIRLGESMPLSADLFDCTAGVIWYFTDLLKHEISPWEVLSWSSSVEMADNYARIFYNRSEEFDEKSYLCNCTKEGSFGKGCEYKLLFDTSSFSKALQMPFTAKNNLNGHQQWGRILCYETLVCDYGMLCLDWRNICDGAQNCMDGIDEENCDKLEFNECENDEYRCVNGMCIPEEYWLDGQQDCMDWSDEMTVHSSIHCGNHPWNIECDDRICPHKTWSCGDGQCIINSDRIVFQTVNPKMEICLSMREYSFICETTTEYRLWTKGNGLCAPNGFRDHTLILSLPDDRCVFLIRCALSRGAEITCPCNGKNCHSWMRNDCNYGEMYKYPRRGIVRPWITHFYKWNQTWDDPIRDVLMGDGRLRCRGFYVNITLEDHFSNATFLAAISGYAIESFLCTTSPEKSKIKESSYQYPVTCWNDSLTFNGRPYAFHDVCRETGECISQYRIGNGILDCEDNQDEDHHILSKINFCHNIQKHRFQCSPQHKTCLSARELVIHAFMNITGCTDKSDVFMKGDGRKLTTIPCTSSKDSSECHLLRYYIGNSSDPNSTFIYDQDKNNNARHLLTTVPFKLYCDTFWDDELMRSDEDSVACHTWICDEQQFQCRTGQCIELDWVCDGEWDCRDASDEFGLFEDWSDHNRNLSNLDERKKQCLENYDTLPFFEFCDYYSEYPCYRAAVPDPLNILKYRPCINITQIGDGIEDCYGSIDEKNTFEDCSGHMLGHSLRCGDQCSDLSLPCIYKQDSCRTSLLCSFRSNNSSWCHGHKDVVCLNGTCVPNARCDGKHQCTHGEDEHWCSPREIIREGLSYRYLKKKSRRRNDRTSILSSFPGQNIQENKIKDNGQSRLLMINDSKTNQQIHWQNLSPKSTISRLDMMLYVCNRGFPLLIFGKNQFHCLCPPTFYGTWCEFFADRLSIVTHLVRDTLPQSYMKTILAVVVTLHFEDIVVDHHVFYNNPELELKNSIKQRFYLLYPRSYDYLKRKQKRYFDRTDIINHHPYSVHFDIYSLSDNQPSHELGSFRYPIYFDFLPAFRLATILKFPSWFGNSSLSPCIHNPCSSNSSCKPIFNKNQSFYCSCKSGFSGIHCEKYDSQCSSYCSTDSVCRPNYRGLIGNANHPLCICPRHRFGPRCYLRNEGCKSNPCGPNSTCHLNYDPSGENPVICVCSNKFYGDRCQYENMPIRIHVNMTASVAASVIQFYDIESDTSILALQHQQVVIDLPRMIQYDHKQKQAPPIAILKTHQPTDSPKYFVLYVLPNTTTINIISTPNACPNVLDLIPAEKTIGTSAVYKYHHICRNDTNRFCFYDSNYLCLCQSNDKRANCFGQNPLLDQCHSCVSGGKCIKGDVKVSDDFLCLCRPCHQGRLCEFNSQAFGFTLDSLLIFSSVAVQFVYIGLIFVLLCIGLFTNFCSFITFKRTQPRKFGIGNYLFIVTIFNQWSLLSLFSKFIHIFLGSAGLTNNASCKSLSYLLSIFTRSTYWLTSWVTIDRLRIVLTPTSTSVKNPRTAIYRIVCTLLVIFIVHVHEILFYQTVRDPDSSVIICVTNFDHSIVTIYNRITTLIHCLLPFCIQIISVTLLIIFAARSRAKAKQNKISFRQVLKKQFSMQKELYVTPVTVVFSALPHTIISFSFACAQLSDWKRHVLLGAFIFSYLPQVLGFILYVLPSSEYRKEFRKTFIGRLAFK